MIFRGFAVKLLGSQVKLAMLSRLLLHYKKDVEFTLPPLSEREFAQSIGFSHTAVSNAFEDFYATNLVRPMLIGNSKTWLVNTKSYAFETIVNKPLIELLTISPLKRLEALIQTHLSRHREIDSIAIIFGSIASHIETQTSDIDLLLFAKREEKAKQALAPKLNKLNEECLTLFGNALKPRFAAPLKGFQPEWIREAVDTGIRVNLDEQNC